MRVKVNKYIMKQPYINNFRLVCMSDIHANIKRLNEVIKKLDDLKPDYIAIPGDILDKTNQ